MTIRNFSVDHQSNEAGADTAKLTKNRSYYEKFKEKVSNGMLIEFGMVFVLVCLSFALSTYHFANQSSQSLVPFSAISSCSSHEEVFNLVPQSTAVEIPFTVIFTDYHVGKSSDGYAKTIFTGRWSSCLKESVDNSFQLKPESNAYYNPVVLLFNDETGSYNASSSTNDDCFQLFCGLEYNFYYGLNPSKNFDSYLNDSIFLNVPINGNVELQKENGTYFLTDNQLIASISGTNNSVTGVCSVSVGGFYVNVLTVSNSVVSTGTYLCTQYTSSFQAFSSGLSVALGVMGVCRFFLKAKAYLDG